MSTNEAIDQGRLLLDYYGLNEWKFGMSRATTRFASCCFTSKTIKLSTVLIPYTKDHLVKDILLHEIAHALVGVEHNHDDVWKAKFLEIGGSGLNNGTEDYFECESFNVIKQKHFRFEAVCKNGHHHYRNKVPSEPTTCGFCDSAFNIKYLLTYKRKDSI